jgi:hypothetical protein
MKQQTLKGMSHKGENFAAFTVLLLVAINVAGLGIPVWYNKEHRHSVNATVEKPNCVVHVNVREGLWQRYCIESRVENCELDVQGELLFLYMFLYSVLCYYFYT